MIIFKETCIEYLKDLLFTLDHLKTNYQYIYIIRKNLRFIFWFISFLIYLPYSLYASGGYDNGTSIGKENLGIDLTWNPFNYREKGQSYAVISYGISQNLDIHSYYSIPVNGSDNYYLGIFYQFFENQKLDLATAIGSRRYLLKSNVHIFFPQILYTIYIYNNFRIGGSIVNIIETSNDKRIGLTYDIGFIIPIIKETNKKNKIQSIDLTIGSFRPILWKPDKRAWHPTYSIDIKIKK